MIRKLLVTSLVVAAAVLVAALASRRTVERVERSVRVEAPPAVVLALVADLRAWAAWSPWDRPDPGVRRTFGGPPSGAGASAYWSGNARAGRGRMTIVLATASRVEVEREEEGPSASQLDMAFELAPAGSGTLVSGSTAREVRLLRTLARRLLPGLGGDGGGELAQGLGKLRAVAEARAKAETFRVERAVRVVAPPAAVLAQLADVRGWAAWSPWGRSEPGLRWRYGGPARGAGASAYWSGSGERGRLTILRSGPEGVAAELELEEPLPALADLELHLAPDGDGTRLRWAVAGEVAVQGEVLGRAGRPEEILGPELERGLAELQALVAIEAGAGALR